MTRIILSVTNDIVTDQRIHKIASTLSSQGADIIVVGRKLQKSYPNIEVPYNIKRLKLIFHKKIFFYTAYNIRIFFYLLFKKVDILVANDLDTLPANYLVSKIKRVTLVFDSHEYFTEVPELVHRPLVKKIWLTFEKFLLPRLHYGYTVCHSLANIMYQKYGIELKVVRNVPYLNRTNKNYMVPSIRKGNKKLILYQGAINLGRGLEQLIMAIKILDNTSLIIIGEGDIKINLEQLIQDKKLESKVRLLGRIPHQELPAYTAQADLGISLEQNLGLNYYYSLPNKLFDYIAAEIPVMVSAFPEMQKIVEDYNIGITTGNFEPDYLAGLIDDIWTNKERYLVWKQNLNKAKKELCWENEKEKLLNIFNPFFHKPEHNA